MHQLQNAAAVRLACHVIAMQPLPGQQAQDDDMGFMHSGRAPLVLERHPNPE